MRETRDKSRSSRTLPTWFKVSVGVLVVLVVLKALDLEVFLEIEYDGEPFLAGLTELETYLIPLGLLGVYFVCAWLWHTLFRSGGN